MDWTALPVQRVLLTDLVWPDHDLQPAHLTDPHEPRPADLLPIHVERLITGDLFIHDGRHRVLRALARHEGWIDARVLER